MKNTITFFSDGKQYFFSKDHCQPNIPKHFIPCSCLVPIETKKPPYLLLEPGGVTPIVLSAKEDVVAHYLHNKQEIPNPDTTYQA